MSRFITFEGVDGAGKTTQLRLLAETLRAEGYDLCPTREPGGTPIGDRIRQVVHDVRWEGMTAETETLLYAASRAQLVRELIRPALAEGKIVLCDRYTDSTFAYQGHGRGMDMPTLQQITAFATGDLRPDLTIFLDLDVDDGQKRRKHAAQEEYNRMDQLELATYQRIRQAFLTMAHAEPDRWFVVDASAPIADIQRIVLARVLDVLR